MYFFLMCSNWECTSLQQAMKWNHLYNNLIVNARRCCSASPHAAIILMQRGTNNRNKIVDRVILLIGSAQLLRLSGLVSGDL